jgi:hypothetical protein
MNRRKFAWIFLIAILMVFSTSFVFAGTAVSQAVSNLNNGTNPAYATLKTIMAILFWAGCALAVFKAIHIGIKFIMTPAPGKSDAKEAIMPWAIGAFILAAGGIISPWIIGVIDPGQNDIFDIN